MFLNFVGIIFFLFKKIKIVGYNEDSFMEYKWYKKQHNL